MNVGLGIAGVICVALGLGHSAVGLVWVLPGLTEERVPGTRLGPPSRTIGMVRVAWHIVTIFALASGGILVTLAWAPTVDPKVLLLRSFAVMWLAATAMAFWVGRRRLRALLRLPVWSLWVVLAVLCWQAST